MTYEELVTNYNSHAILVFGCTSPLCLKHCYVTEQLSHRKQPKAFTTDWWQLARVSIDAADIGEIE